MLADISLIHLAFLPTIFLHYYVIFFVCQHQPELKFWCFSHISIPLESAFWYNHLITILFVLKWCFNRVYRQKVIVTEFLFTVYRSFPIFCLIISMSIISLCLCVQNKLKGPMCRCKRDWSDRGRNHIMTLYLCSIILICKMSLRIVKYIQKSWLLGF